MKENGRGGQTGIAAPIFFVGPGLLDELKVEGRAGVEDIFGVFNDNLFRKKGRYVFGY
ncbi:MAG: hypothetical protein GY841_04240 [FCB group bacterium]|nr:hypothetical protein [FCB group bacterium]